MLTYPSNASDPARGLSEMELLGLHHEILTKVGAYIGPLGAERNRLTTVIKLTRRL